MTPPPIPLVDGAFLIDNSGIEKLRCPRMFQYSELSRRSACASRAGANFGSTMHRGWETRYKAFGTNNVDDLTRVKIESEMLAWLAEHPQPENDFRDYNHACKMMAVYNSVYKKEPFKILNNAKGEPIIEASFALPFGTINNVSKDVPFQEIPIFYCGKIDLGIEDNNGIWSFDHKTAFQFGETFDKQMNMDGGQLGYCWALGQVLGRQPQGYIIDAVRVRRPKKQDEFSGIDCIDGTDFKRTPYFVTPEMLEEWRMDVLALIENIFHYQAVRHYPRHRWQCTNKFGLCDYYDVCSSPLSARESILQSGLFETNEWTKGLKI